MAGAKPRMEPFPGLCSNCVRGCPACKRVPGTGELKRCPFDAQLPMIRGGDSVVVRCPCGAQGKTFVFPADASDATIADLTRQAVEAWNMRV